MLSCPLCKENELPFDLEIHQNGTLKKFSRDQVLFKKGDPVTRVYFIYSGTVRILGDQKNEFENVLDLIQRGFFIGLEDLWGSEQYSTSASVEIPGTILVFEAKPFKKLLSQNQKLMQNLCMLLLQRIKDQAINNMAIKHLNGSSRILNFLKQASKSSPKTNGEFQLPARKRELASFLGMRPESFSRAFHQLEKDGVIKAKGSIVRLDLNQTIVS